MRHDIRKLVEHFVFITHAQRLCDRVRLVRNRDDVREQRSNILTLVCADGLHLLNRCASRRALDQLRVIQLSSSRSRVVGRACRFDIACARLVAANEILHAAHFAEAFMHEHAAHRNVVIAERIERPKRRSCGLTRTGLRLVSLHIYWCFMR